MSSSSVLFPKEWARTPVEGGDHSTHLGHSCELPELSELEGHPSIFFPLWCLVQQLAKYQILLGRSPSYKHVLPFHGRNRGSRTESSVVMLN